MSLPIRYEPEEYEPALQAQWQQQGIYRFEPEDARPIYSIDTPPATVSGNLHLGHVYSYSHADFMARFFRMNGYNIYYPMGYDDNGNMTSHAQGDVYTWDFKDRLIRAQKDTTDTRFGSQCHRYPGRREDPRRLARLELLPRAGHPP